MKNLVILEGISGAGKSTLLAALNRARNFQDYHWHRFTATEWVYGAIQNRPVLLPDLRQYEQKVAEIWPTVLVTLTCDPYIAVARKEHDPKEIIEPQIALANKLFIVYHKYLTSFSRKIMLNTNELNVDKCVDYVLSRLEI